MNIVLRPRFEGIEARARYGTVTDGNFEKAGVSLTGGQKWSTGSAVLSYEYSGQTNLDRTDRPFARLPLGDLIPESETHNFALNGQQTLGPIRLVYDTLYTHRDVLFEVPQSEFSLFPDESRDVSSKALGSFVNAYVPVANTWEFNVGAGFSTQKIDAANTDLIAGAAYRLIDHQNKLYSFNSGLSGTLFTLPAGEVRATFGGNFRRETFELIGRTPGVPTPAYSISGEREIVATFAEARVPILDTGGAGTEPHLLVALLALRHEHYSDFGGTTNPKFGLSWTAFDGFTMRGSYGTSFRAPSFNQLDLSNNYSVLTFLADPDSANQSLVLVRAGNSPEFSPERSTSWDVGFDFSPTFLPGLRVQADYFRLRFRDRYQRPSAVTAAILPNAGPFADIIVRNPTAAQMAEAIANPGAFGIFNFTNSTPEQATVIIDNRSQNIGATTVSGIDLRAQYETRISDVGFSAFLDIAHLFEFENRVTPASPPNDTLDTLFNPIQWRLRGGLGVERDGFLGSVQVAYVPSYSNNQIAPAGRIESWTTVDVVIGYSTDDRAPPALKNMTYRLSAQNLFDQGPPLVPSAGAAGVMPTGFDPANASPIGRFVNFELIKQF